MWSRGPPFVDDGDMVFRVDRWSRYQWARFFAEQPTAEQALRRGAERYYGYPRLTRDLFARMFGDVDERNPRPRPEDEWVVRMHDALDELPDMARMQRRTRGDRTLAGQAALWLAERALDALPEPPPAEDPQPIREQVEGLMALADANEGLLDAGLHANQVDGLRSEGQARVAKARAFDEGLDDSDLRRALRSGLEGTKESVDALEAQIAAFGGWSRSGGGPLTMVNGAKAGIARMLGSSEKLKRLAAEAGRMRRIAARKQRGRVDHGADELADIERGADLGRLLPTELAKLADPMRMPEVARGLAERSLLQFRLRSTESLGRGPVVVCLDQSSSMEGGREIWSKGLALALLQVAVLQKRACRVVHFASEVVQVDDWAPGKVDPMGLLESMAPFHGGGTDFEAPLRAALDAIRDEAHLKKADVVLVTDGEAEVSDAFAEEWRAARARHDFAVYAVHIDAGGTPPPVLSLVADEVLALTDIRDDAHVTEAVLSL